MAIWKLVLRFRLMLGGGALVLLFFCAFFSLIVWGDRSLVINDSIVRRNIESEYGFNFPDDTVIANVDVFSRGSKFEVFIEAKMPRDGFRFFKEELDGRISYLMIARMQRPRYNVKWWPSDESRLVEVYALSALTRGEGSVGSIYIFVESENDFINLYMMASEVNMELDGD